MKFLISFFVVYAAFVVTASPFTEENDDVKWKNYKHQHNKKHSSKEDAIRKAHFLKVDKEIKLHNADPKATYKKAHNRLSDLSPEEKKKQLFGARVPKSQIRSLGEKIRLPVDRQAPKSLDYSKSPCVGPVKQQKPCGSCWAFSALAPLEYSHCMKNQKIYVSLSEQQLVDCATDDFGFTLGCDGGLTDWAWDSIQAKGGFVPEKSYPYLGVQGTCVLNQTNVVAQMASYSKVANDVDSIVNALNLYGPLSAYFLAGDVYNYSFGVYRDRSCVCVQDNCPINHAVTIVGYGTDSMTGLDYWLVRNSWGSNWGLNGYILIQKGVKNWNCGIENYVLRVSAK